MQLPYRIVGGPNRTSQVIEGCNLLHRIAGGPIGLGGCNLS